MIGRTSIDPYRAQGILAAMAIASLAVHMRAGRVVNFSGGLSIRRRLYNTLADCSFSHILPAPVVRDEG